MANLRTITNFKSALKGGGARPNLFEVNMNWPGGENMGNWGNDVEEEFQFLCKAAALPSSTITEIPVRFRGRILKVAGDRTFDTWTITIINDTDFAIRQGFENWMQKIAQHADASGDTDPSSYMADITVDQLSRNASAVGSSPPSGDGLEAVKSYKFYDVFPTNISAVDLSYDTGDTIEEFTVELQVQYWESIEGSVSNQK